MEKERPITIKKILLIGFVTISLVLILTIWFHAFFSQDTENPYFYRELPQQAEIINTATMTPSLQATVTPAFKATPIVIPTQTNTPEFLFTPEADN